MNLDRGDMLAIDAAASFEKRYQGLASTRLADSSMSDHRAR